VTFLYVSSDVHYRRVLMKHLCILAGLLSAVAVTAADIPVKKVVVFSHQAEIHRSAKQSLKAGSNIVSLDGLPWELLDTTLRVQVDGGVTVNRIEVENVRERLVREADAAKVKEEVEALQADIHLLTSKAGRLQNQLGFMRKIQVKPRSLARDAAPEPIALEPDSWMKVLDFIDAGMQGYDKELTEINARLAAGFEELEVLQTKLERLSSRDVKNYRNVHIHLDSPAAKDATVSVVYMVSGPQWFPRYEVRADVPKNRLQLLAFALVRQNTGEDWKDVDLSFSTASRAAGGADIVRYAAGYQSGAKRSATIQCRRRQHHLQRRSAQRRRRQRHRERQQS
jgi:uncharacterized protein (TIGR02231 family)